MKPADLSPLHRFPKIFNDPTVGEEARSLYDEAQSMLSAITADSSLQARAVVAFFPANSEGDDILVYADDDSVAPRWTLHGIRQQQVNVGGRQRECRCISDFVAPRESGVRDYIGMFAVSAGFGCEELCRRFSEANNDDYSSIMTSALADRLSEAFAELLHQKVTTGDILRLVVY